MSISPNDLAFVARKMQERFGVGIAIRQTPFGGFVVETRYSAKAEVEIKDGLRGRPAEVLDVLYEGCVAATLKLCSHVQSELMKFGDDQDEARAIRDLAYKFRTACMEAQYYWERCAKSEKNTIGADYLEREYTEKKRIAESLRADLLKAAGAGHEVLL